MAVVVPESIPSPGRKARPSRAREINGVPRRVSGKRVEPIRRSEGEAIWSKRDALSRLDFDGHSNETRE